MFDRYLRSLIVVVGCLLVAGGCGDREASQFAQNNAPDAGSDTDTCVPEDEICDGLDNDCDGEIDEDAVDAVTYYRDEDGDGFGTDDDTVETCEPPEGYVTESGDCDDDDPSVHPGADELCNGVDNDCDDEIDENCCEADEACCEAEQAPDAVEIASSVVNEAPVIVPAADGAPDEAAFLVAWLTTSHVELLHVDQRGEATDSTASIEADEGGSQTPTGLDVITTSRGYEVVWTTHYATTVTDETTLRAQGRDAQLEEDGRIETYADYTVAGTSEEEPRRLFHPRVAASDNERFLVWAESYDTADGEEFNLSARQYNVNDRANPERQLDLTPNRGGRSDSDPLLAAVASGNDDFAVAWANGAEQTVYGITYEAADNSPTPTFEIEADAAAAGEPIDVWWTGNGELGVIYPTLADSDEENDDGEPIERAVLTHNTVAVDDAQVGEPTDLTEPDAESSQPYATLAEDRLLVTFQRTAQVEDEDDQRTEQRAFIVTARVDADEPDLAEPVRRLTGGDGSPSYPSLAISDLRAAALWIERSGGTTVEFATSSREGQPICDLEDETDAEE